MWILNNVPQFEWFCLGKKTSKVEAAQASADRALWICSWVSGAEIQSVGRLLTSDLLLGQWVSALAAHRIVLELSGLPIPGLSPRDSNSIGLWSSPEYWDFLLLKVGFIDKQYLHHPGACCKSQNLQPYPSTTDSEPTFRRGPPSLRACFTSTPRLMGLNITWKWKQFNSVAESWIDPETVRTYWNSV